MKDKAIGFLIGVCMFLLIGTIETPTILETPPEQVIRQLIGLDNSKASKFQGFAVKSEKYLLNTQNGVLYKCLNDKDSVWERISSSDNWINE